MATDTKLFAALGSKDITSTGKVGRDKVAARHPLNKRIVTMQVNIEKKENLQRPTPKTPFFIQVPIMYFINSIRMEQIRAEWHRKNIISGVASDTKYSQR